MSRRLNVLMLNHNPKGAGTYFRCMHFARRLVTRGHRVTLLTGGTNRFIPKTDWEHGVEVVSTPRFRRLADLIVPGGLDSGFLDILYRSGRATFGGFDILHGFDHLHHVSFPSIIGRFLNRTCFVSDWCDWWSRGGFPTPRFKKVWQERMEARLEEGLRRVADGVTLISSVLYQRCLGLGVPADRMRVIPSGADVVGIVPGDMTIARERVGIPSDAKVVGFVGFVDVDVDLVLTAVARIAPRWPQVKVLIVGEIEFARTTAIRLGIEDKVILAGIQPYVALPDYFAACDVLAMPLRDTLFNRARWPNKTGDYLAAGRPIVSNPVGDVRSIFERHPVGLLAAPDDPTAFGTQLERLFADPALATRLGLEARRLAEGELSWERLTDDLVDFYLTTLDRKRIRGRRYPRGREQ